MRRGRSVRQRGAGGRLMDTPDPIDTYLRELKRELRARGRARRRILAEVRVHLLDAAEAERSRGAEEGVAAQRAVVRFGLAAETARQFNCLAGRRGSVIRRALVPWIAAVALTSTATATVWAFQAGPTPPRQAFAHPALRQRCVQRAGAPAPARAGRDVSRASTAPRTRAVCGAARERAMSPQARRAGGVASAHASEKQA
jgi:hypothetical protein